jgi:hypothetical protein
MGQSCPSLPLSLFFFFSPAPRRLIALIATRGINFPLRRRHAGPLIGHGISLRVIRRRLIVACAAGPALYLPIGSGHSTLIKVSSMRSAGWGNRSITRASALSTLPMIALLRIRRILSGRLRPACLPNILLAPDPYPSWLTFPDRTREISSKVDRPAPPRALSLGTPFESVVRQEYRGGWHAYKSLSMRASERVSSLSLSLSLSFLSIRS